ncbi:MAG: hypothetical protein ACMXYK_05695, partial [Candidatus Woesearchaeota archaeon]
MKKTIAQTIRAIKLKDFRNISFDDMYTTLQTNLSKETIDCACILLLAKDISEEKKLSIYLEDMYVKITPHSFTDFVAKNYDIMDAKEKIVRHVVGSEVHLKSICELPILDTKKNTSAVLIPKKPSSKFLLDVTALNFLLSIGLEKILSKKEFVLTQETHSIIKKEVLDASFQAIRLLPYVSERELVVSEKTRVILNLVNNTFFINKKPLTVIDEYDAHSIACALEHNLCLVTNNVFLQNLTSPSVIKKQLSIYGSVTVDVGKLKKNKKMSLASA